MTVGLDDVLADRLRAAGIDPAALAGPGGGPWEAWLRLCERDGRQPVLPGTDRPGDPHEVACDNAAWPALFGR